jgi:hypothetical protein
MTNDTPKADAWSGRVLFQGWISIAVWMSAGLLLEGLLGFKIPAYLQDETRRELFRLAHAHGTLLGLVLVAASLTSQRLTSPIPHLAVLALQLGSAIMPLGFFIAGIWHTETDPGLAIWLVPPGAVLVIFGVVSIALAVRKQSKRQ